MSLFVQSSCVVSPQQLLKDGKSINLPVECADTDTFLKEVLRNRGYSYPKFYKMDTLSKLGFLTAEILLEGNNSLSQLERHRCGLVVQNTHSTLLTDRTHLQAITNPEAFFPSPAVFVYTLPNIVTGEICIRHKLMGENAVYMVDAPKPDELYRQVSLLFDQNLVDAILCGYIDLAPDGYFLSVLYYVEKQDKTNRNTIFDADFIFRSYKNL